MSSRRLSVPGAHYTLNKKLFVGELRERWEDVETGRFRAMMEVHMVNWGPVTLMQDSKKGP